MGLTAVVAGVKYEDPTTKVRRHGVRPRCPSAPRPARAASSTHAWLVRRRGKGTRAGATKGHTRALLLPGTLRGSPAPRAARAARSVRPSSSFPSDPAPPLPARSLACHTHTVEPQADGDVLEQRPDEPAGRRRPHQRHARLARLRAPLRGRTHPARGRAHARRLGRPSARRAAARPPPRAARRRSTSRGCGGSPVGSTGHPSSPPEMAGFMSVPKSTHRMSMVDSGSGMARTMKARKGVTSGMFEVSV